MPVPAILIETLPERLQFYASLRGELKAEFEKHLEAARLHEEEAAAERARQAMQAEQLERVESGLAEAKEEVKRVDLEMAQVRSKISRIEQVAAHAFEYVARPIALVVVLGRSLSGQRGSPGRPPKARMALCERMRELIETGKESYEAVMKSKTTAFGATSARQARAARALLAQNRAFERKL
jgi:hypothetical protein